MDQIRICLPGSLWTNQVETNRLGTRFATSAFERYFNVPDDLLRELMWPPHIPLPSLENPTDDESDAGEAMSSLVNAPWLLPDRFPNYTYDPRHMLCLSCHRDVLGSKFWSWWEIQRRLPPVSAPNQPNCWRGMCCDGQGDTDHATMYNVSDLFDPLASRIILTVLLSTGALIPFGSPCTSFPKALRSIADLPPCRQSISRDPVQS